MKHDDASKINPETNIDRALISIIEVAAALSVVIVAVFSIYLLGGFVLLQTGSMTFPYQFLSVNSDPVFNTLATLSGITIGTACLALAFFTLVSQNDDVDIGIVLFFAIVGVGFAAGLVRMSLSVTSQFLGTLVL